MYTDSYKSIYTVKCTQVLIKYLRGEMYTGSYKYLRGEMYTGSYKSIYGVKCKQVLIKVSTR